MDRAVSFSDLFSQEEYQHCATLAPYYVDPAFLTEPVVPLTVGKSQDSPVSDPHTVGMSGLPQQSHSQPFTWC